MDDDFKTTNRANIYTKEWNRTKQLLQHNGMECNYRFNTMEWNGTIVLFLQQNGTKREWKGNSLSVARDTNGNFLLTPTVYRLIPTIRGQTVTKIYNKHQSSICGTMAPTLTAVNVKIICKHFSHQ